MNTPKSSAAALAVSERRMRKTKTQNAVAARE